MRDLSQSFDAILTGKNGVAIPVSCRIEPPLMGGLPARIELSVPGRPRDDADPLNPCSVIGRYGRMVVSLSEVWYGYLPKPGEHDKVTLAAVRLTHVGRLRYKPAPFPQQTGLQIFLSPVRHFRRLSSAEFFSPAGGAATLFELDLPATGKIAIRLEWCTIYNDRDEPPGGTIKAGYSAWLESSPDSAELIEQQVKRVREALLMLSLLCRQGIAVHGWATSEESVWLDPLAPNIAPNSAKPGEYESTFPDEFVEVAKQLCSAYMSANPKLKKLLRHMSVAVASHVERSAVTAFMTRFAVLEQALDFGCAQSPTGADERTTDNRLVGELSGLRDKLRGHGDAQELQMAERLEGFIRIVKSGARSFATKLEVFRTRFPSYRCLEEDLWPIDGTSKKPGLKQLRNPLAHSLPEGGAQIIGVANWHLRILLERLVFVLLDVPLPKGLQPSSFFLAQEMWYGRAYWNDLQHQARRFLDE